MTNPFFNRLPVTDPSRFFGRRHQASRILELIGAKVPQSCYVVGGRRIGKTSLVNYVSHPDGGLKEFASLLSKGAEEYLFVKVDLELLEQDLSSKSSMQLDFFKLLFLRLHEEISRLFISRSWQKKLSPLNEIYQSRIQSSSLSDVVSFGFRKYFIELSQMTRLTVVIVLDEADKLVQSGVGTILRSLLSSQNWPLSCILVTQQFIQDLDPEKILSPLYNLLTPVLVGLMDDTDIDMVSKPASKSGLAFSKVAKTWIWNLGGKHPDFINVVARHVYDNCPNAASSDELEKSYSRIYADLEPICQNLWNSLLGSSRTPDEEAAEIIKLMSLIIKGMPIPSKYSEKVARFVERGLFIKNGTINIFSRIFEDFVNKRIAQSEAVALVTPVTITSESTKKTTHLLTFDDHFLRFKDIVVPLGKNEISLFRYLYENSPRVCSRKELFEVVWKDEYDDQKDAVINIAVQRLRNKLKRYLRDLVVIQSERSQGYRIIVTELNN